MHQQNGCVRTQFSENVCVIQNIVVPLHRQKKKAYAKRATQQRKGKKMKKMILTLVAMLSMTTAFAEGEMVMGANNMEAYELNVNINKLSEALDLADDQKEAVADIHHTFASELMFAAQYGENDRKKLVARALDNDVKWMRYVLNDKQFRTYLSLLNSTMNNRGLNK